MCIHQISYSQVVLVEPALLKSYIISFIYTDGEATPTQTFDGSAAIEKSYNTGNSCLLGAFFSKQLNNFNSKHIAMCSKI